MPENEDLHFISFCSHLNRGGGGKAQRRFSSNNVLHQEGSFSNFI